MKVIIVAGFLGSGKTTLVLAVAERLIQAGGKKVSIIVNDFGAVGIDGKVMEKYGLQIMELSSGCICCALGPDLVKTVHDLESNIAPDIIMIEPTGVADPRAIVSALKDYRTGPITITTMVIIDAVRLGAIARALSMQLETQMRAADMILVNKMDVVDEKALFEVNSVLSTVPSSVKVMQISALNGSGVLGVVDEIEKIMHVKAGS
jgi:G3E family GTPase